jgi:hypothetical protein
MHSRTKFARVVVAVVTALVLAPLLGRAFLEVSQGRADGTYQNFKGMQIYWISVLVFAGVAVLALLIGLVVRWWHRRDIRSSVGNKS